MQIDLLSDTVTRPTAGMLAAMQSAVVGDDVFGEDPTARALEQRVAALLGHEAALFMPSGVMSNQIAIKTHTEPMDELICDETSHVYRYENGGYAFHSQIAICPLKTVEGKLGVAEIAAAIKPKADWLPRSRLVVLENTGNAAGGNYYRAAEIEAIAQFCRERDLRLHLDGARLFNALIATGEAASTHGALFDSVSICLSKGLGAPVGSVLAGGREFIAKARRLRKGFGGGMRQIGYLAAAGLYALDHHVERLAIDHAHAQQLADVLRQHPDVAGLRPVHTNIVIFDLRPGLSAADFLAKLAALGIRASAFGPQTVRFVTHLDVGPEQVAAACERIAGMR